MRQGLSGCVPVRNAIALDYCAKEAVESFLPICDEVVVCDSDSTDGTREIFDEWAKRESKIRVINYPWPNPVNDQRMLAKWLNFARQHFEYNMQLATDADEVLCPKAYSGIRECCQQHGSRWFYRLHFWKDAQHVTQDNKVVGSHIARLGPTEWEMTSDELRHEGEPPIRQNATYDSRLRFFHYGFLRKPAGFFAKSKVMQHALCNTYDDRLRKAENENIPWTDLMDTGGPLVDYTLADHPEPAKQWLRDRGYTP
jgi:glycosyltransferase involved in cell wall biosynthesis